MKRLYLYGQIKIYIIINQVKTSYVNDFEAGIIVRKVKELLENGITEDMIQILTLYEAQRKLIKEKLDTANIVRFTVFILYELYYDAQNSLKQYLLSNSLFL